jgi:hypothetical protein
MAGSSSGTGSITSSIIIDDNCMNSDVKREVPGTMIGKRAVRGKGQRLSYVIHEAVATA